MSVETEEAGGVSTPPIKLGSQLWALEKCRFPLAWQILDERRDADPGPIAIIDVGCGALDHPSIKPRIEERIPRKPDSSSALHAGGVAAIIGAANDLPRMSGACAARLHVYNAWTNSGFDRQAFLDALDDVASSGARVLNLSVGGPEKDAEIEAAIKHCLAKNVVVVAAMGDVEEPVDVESYPAAIDGVIAVGATNRHDRRLPESGVGKHISVSAPGQQIWTVVSNDAYGYRGGTSFAAPLVSAAAWLAVRALPDATPADIKQLLEETAVASPPSATPRWAPDVGYGRLDVGNLARRIGSARRELHTPVQVRRVETAA